MLWEGYNTVACAYGKEGEKCLIGNNTAGRGHGGCVKPSSKFDELTYVGKLNLVPALSIKNQRDCFFMVKLFEHGGIFSEGIGMYINWHVSVRSQASAQL